jgi:hypothetical protein
VIIGHKHKRGEKTLSEAKKAANRAQASLRCIGERARSQCAEKFEHARLRLGPRNGGDARPRGSCGRRSNRINLGVGDRTNTAGPGKRSSSRPEMACVPRGRDELSEAFG